MKLKLFLAVLMCAGIAAAQSPPGAVFTPNFQNTDIAVVANAVTEATGVTFILEPAAATRKITLTNRRPMSGQQFYDTFLSILQTQGFVAMPSGNRTMKIVQETNARTLPGSELSASSGPDEMVHVTIPVKNINSQQVATVLNQFRSSYGVIQAVPGTNQIIISDRAANVRRMRDIIQSVDKESSGEMDVLQLQHATAADVVRTLQQLIGTQQQAANASAGTAPRITAETRTNSVLVLGEPAQRLQIAAWVASLDTPLAQGGGEPEVIYLKYGEADSLAPLLKEFATGLAQSEAVAAAGGAPAGGGAAAPVQTVSTSGADRSTTILAEPNTNALIVTAPPKMMRELKAIISRLDIPRQQVFIEAIIAEVSTDKASDLGVNWGLFQDDDGKIIPGGGFIAPAGGASIVDLGAAVANPSALVSGNVSVPLGGTFGLGRLSENGVSWAAVLRALRTDSESNVIAEPKLLALDNEESVFQDGQTVPFLSGLTTSFGGVQGGGGGGGGNFFTPTQDIDRQDIGTKLTITPQINTGGAMTLDIQLESSELSGATGDAGSPITNKRSFDTKVRVDDGQTIVLAGMIRNFERKSETRVPFLGRIPLLGELFKVRGGQRQQKMLMVFIRPRILVDGTLADAETQSKYNLIRDKQIEQGSKFELIELLPGESSPVLPELEQPANPIQPPPAGGATTSPVP